MKHILIFGLSLVFLLAGCAGTMQIASISEAHKKYQAEDYKQVLVLINRAENARETTPEMKAELTYLKAQTYEKLGRNEDATTLYEYLRDQHANSQYGYLAAKKLSGSPAEKSQPPGNP